MLFVNYIEKTEYTQDITIFCMNIHLLGQIYLIYHKKHTHALQTALLRFFTYILVICVLYLYNRYDTKTV